MVRLVFRPYTQIWRSICTSESLRASTRVSSGFTLFKYSSPSFGSQQICSYSNLSNKYPDRSMVPLLSHLHSLSFRIWVCHPNTRIYVRLLGPCFKTGRIESFRQHPKRLWWNNPIHVVHTTCSQNFWPAVVQQGHKDYSPIIRCVPQSKSMSAIGGYNTAKAATFRQTFVHRSELMLTSQQQSAPANLRSRITSSFQMGIRQVEGPSADLLKRLLIPCVSLLTISRTV